MQAVLRMASALNVPSAEVGSLKLLPATLAYCF